MNNPAWASGLRGRRIATSSAAGTTTHTVNTVDAVGQSPERTTNRGHQLRATARTACTTVARAPMVMMRTRPPRPTLVERRERTNHPYANTVATAPAANWPAATNNNGINMTTCVRKGVAAPPWVLARAAALDP